MHEREFPLVEKVSKAGGYDGRGMLISAPKATGKSKIGIDLWIIFR